MKRIKIVLVLLIAFAAPVFAKSQTNYYNTAHKSAIKVLSQMIGSWSGEGWMLDQATRQKKTFTQTEEIQFLMDSTLLQVQGIGKSEGKVVHHALAVVTIADEGGFYLNSFLGDGRKGRYHLYLDQDTIIWEIPTEQGMVQYSIVIEEGVWKEEGVFVMNNQRFPFLGMTLTKQQ